MLRIITLVALGMIGCGRLSFESAPRDDASGPADAPPVPSSICRIDRIPLQATPSAADLAVAPTSGGYAAIWVDTTKSGGAHGAVLGPNHQLMTSLAMPDITDTRLGGVADAGEKLVLASATINQESLQILGRDLETVSRQTTLTSHVMGHNPYSTDVNQTLRVFLTAHDNTLEMSYVASDGLTNLGQPSLYTVTGPITDLACNDGPTHAHCVWAETIAGTPQCTMTDISLIPTAAQVGSHLVLSSDCYDFRNASGPVAADSMIVVWTTQAHEVKAHYTVSTGDVERLISKNGSAPKVQFDGTRFWIAWLDDQNALQLSSFDINGTVINYSLAGWTPNGPEAFELVHRGNETGVVLLSPTELDFLTICT